MKRKLGSLLSGVVLASLMIWGMSVTAAEVRADPLIDCVSHPYMCEDWDGNCGGICIKDLFPATETCCWVLPD